MEEFASLIQTETGEDVLVDINTIVESIAKTESINSDVVEIALTKIAEAKEGLRAWLSLKPQFDENELGEGTPVQLCISSKKRKTVKQIGTAL